MIFLYVSTFLQPVYIMAINFQTATKSLGFKVKVIQQHAHYAVNVQQIGVNPNWLQTGVDPIAWKVKNGCLRQTNKTHCG